MPLPDHVVNAHKGSGGNESRSGRQGKESERRSAIPVDVDDASPSILTPFMSHLPSLSGMSSLKGFLPQTSGRSGLRGVKVTDEGMRASWQVADLGDGHGKIHLLVLYSASHALQVFRHRSGAIPADPHVPEVFPAPEEVFSLASIRCDHKTDKIAVAGVEVHVGEGRTLCARIIDSGPLRAQHGPVAAVITLSSQKKSAQGALALVIVSLASGIALKHVSLGVGSSASMEASSKAIIVAISRTTAAIHIFDPLTLASLHPPLIDLPVDPHTGLPVFALAGRLLAHATSVLPARLGPEALGSLVSAQSTQPTRSSYPDAQATTQASHPLSTSESAQGAILASAAEIGGSVARGVWAGIKMGAKAASQARSNRLARSAPVEASGSLADVESEENLNTEPKDIEEDNIADGIADTQIEDDRGGEWVRILDIRPRSRLPSATSRVARTVAHHDIVPSCSTGGLPQPEVIAHFRSPPSRSHVPLATDHPRNRGIATPRAKSQRVSQLSFNPIGTQLLVALEDGKSQHVFEIHPVGAKRQMMHDLCGEVWHLYELRRGNTAAKVVEVTWADDGRWVGVETSRGTIHIFAINPTGGPASATTHVSTRPLNPQQLYPLSTVITAPVRVRPRQFQAESNGEDTVTSEGPGCFTFALTRRNLRDCGAVCQDMVVFRPGTAQIELCRLTSRPVLPKSSPMVPGQRRASALTEMMRAKAFGEGSDLEVKKTIKARWSIPLGSEAEQSVVTLDSAGQTTSSIVLGPSLAHAEIHTYCIHPRILPGTIYLSRQIEFYAARPIDDFSPLSIMDVEARTRRLAYRLEVEARSTSPEVKSFDEPLLSALHSMIESPSNSQLPGLPNGSPGMSRWRNIPIRPIAAGLGEGVDRVRREYVRAQHSRAKRRASMAAQNGLSFEDDTVFAGRLYDEEEGSSPSSALLPATNTESSGEGDDEWNVGWEEEYARAVEDDGGPEELVLGMMDLEEEERRSWTVQPKQRYR